MESSRKIKQRRKNTQNILKITKTMELVSKVKFQKSLNVSNQFQKYKDEFLRIFEQNHFGSFSHDLLVKREKISRVLLLVIGGNRGLCGNYNIQIAEECIQLRNKLLSEGKEVEIHLAGKKAFSVFCSKKIAYTEQYHFLDEKKPWDSVVSLATKFIDLFQKKYYDELWILYTYKMRIQKEILLPVWPCIKKEEKECYFMYSPDKEKILEYLLSHLLEIQMYAAILSAIASEHLSRMLAMKQSSENADNMIKEMTKQYNRARQAQITREMLEILSGIDGK